MLGILYLTRSEFKLSIEEIRKVACNLYNISYKIIVTIHTTYTIFI